MQNVEILLLTSFYTTSFTVYSLLYSFRCVYDFIYGILAFVLLSVCYGSSAYLRRGPRGYFCSECSCIGGESMAAMRVNRYVPTIKAEHEI